jgi:formylmethanofuran dehydrogenase subunit A
MEAVAKMTLLPAKRLEEVSPAMKKKGRLQVGADADITVFDLGTIRDTANFEDDLSFSEGVVQVLVAGEFVVRDSQSVKLCCLFAYVEMVGQELANIRVELESERVTCLIHRNGEE